MFLRATRGARNPSLQVVITHEPLVSIVLYCICIVLHSFGRPLRTNGMHKTQFDHVRFDLLPLVI